MISFADIKRTHIMLDKPEDIRVVCGTEAEIREYFKNKVAPYEERYNFVDYFESSDLPIHKQITERKEMSKDAVSEFSGVVTGDVCYLSNLHRHFRDYVCTEWYRIEN